MPASIKTVRDILSDKGNNVVSIRPEQTLREAMKLITDNKIGALIVCRGEEEIDGIVTERDILWNINSTGENALGHTVQDVMTRKVIVGVPEDNIETVEKFMTVNRIRHIPIIEGKKLVGIVSIGDIVKSYLSNLEIQNRYLTDYITGKYPA